MDYNELYHYGVKGMKWGVRRAREDETTSRPKKAPVKVKTTPTAQPANKSRKKTKVSKSKAQYKKDVEKMCEALETQRKASRIASTAALASTTAAMFGRNSVASFISEMGSMSAASYSAQAARDWWGA